VLILGHADVGKVLADQQDLVLGAVRQAYMQHARGNTTVPESVFLRFPHEAADRIIALPAYLGGPEPVAGMKWVASFPGNVRSGLARASAVIVLNSLTTGRPLCLLEGSAISIQRTAASAALASATMPSPEPVWGVAVIGCGLVNAEVLRYLTVVHPGLREVAAFDLDVGRAESFARRCETELNVTVRLVGDAQEALAAHPLVSIATTATIPYLGLRSCRPGALILHLSLRDVTIEGVMDAVNIVDDTDHVLRAATSVHLAEQHAGNRDFIRGTIGDLLLTETKPRDSRRVTLFSPFGLGVLDLAVASVVLREARLLGLGVTLPDFLPEPEDARRPG